VPSFQGVLRTAERGGAYVEVPDGVVEALGGGRRIPVRATFGGIDYRGSIVSMGGEAMVIGVLKSIRDELGAQPGDAVSVTVDRDDAPRSVEVPADLAAALDAAGLTAAFAALSYSHQREYVRSIEDAKRPATRARRVEQTIERLGG
jgi:hypothetical protein